MKIHIKNIIYLYVIFCFYFSTAYAPSCGLTNARDDCFTAATMQAFFTIKPLKDYLSTLKIQEDSIPGQFRKTLDIMSTSQIASNIGTTFRAFLTKKDHTLFGAMGGGQQDADEMFKKILCALREADYHAIANPSGSISEQDTAAIQKHITDIFAFHYLHKKKCLTCGVTELQEELTTDLALNLFFEENKTGETFSEQETGNQDLKKLLQSEFDQNTSSSIKELLRAYTAQISKPDGFICEQCQSKNTTIRTVLLKNAPSIFFVSFRRFKIIGFNAAGNPISEKLNNKITFELGLDLSPYLDHESAQYQLIAIVVQSGATGGGHYYGYFKDSQDPRKWFLANDASFNEMSEADIQKICDMGQAYFLIYEKLTPTAPNFGQPAEATQSPLEILKNKLISVKDNLEVLQKKLTSLKIKIGELKTKLTQFVTS